MSTDAERWQMRGLTKELAGGLIAGLYVWTAAFAEFLPIFHKTGGFATNHQNVLAGACSVVLGITAGWLVTKGIRRLPSEGDARSR